MLQRERELKRAGDPTKVSYDDETAGWLHVSERGSLVLPEPRGFGVRAFESQTLELFCTAYTPQVGDVILDIGAGVGTEAIFFADRVGPSGLVVAVEAHPETARYLQRAKALNALPQVSVIAAAVVDQPGEVVISDQGSEHTHVNHLNVADGVKVPGITLAGLVEELELEQVSLLKMNIEGAERAALVGAEPVLPIVQNVAIGCHDFLADETGDDFFRTLDAVRSMLTRAGFDVYTNESDERPWARHYVYGSRQRPRAST